MTDRTFSRVKGDAAIIAQALIDTIKSQKNNTGGALVGVDITDVINALDGMFKSDSVIFTGAYCRNGVYRIYIDSVDLEQSDVLIETAQI